MLLSLLRATSCDRSAAPSSTDFVLGTCGARSIALLHRCPLGCLTTSQTRLPGIAVTARREPVTFPARALLLAVRSMRQETNELAVRKRRVRVASEQQLAEDKAPRRLDQRRRPWRFRSGIVWRHQTRPAQTHGDPKRSCRAIKTSVLRLGRCEQRPLALLAGQRQARH